MEITNNAEDYLSNNSTNFGSICSYDFRRMKCEKLTGVEYDDNSVDNT